MSFRQSFRGCDIHSTPAVLLKFTKMHGLGNDFVVLDATSRPLTLTPAQIRLIADRRFGVGCDQVLQVEPAKQAGNDFFYRIFNADGGEVEQCGNGARCFARFVTDRGLTNKREIRVETRGGVLVPKLEDDGNFTVDMGEPVFEPDAIPFLAEKRALTYMLHFGDDISERNVEISALALGNPHAVQIVDDIDVAPVADEGPLIERNERFPQRVNAGYMQVLDRGHIRLRVFERGVGETLSCGSGACAAVVAGIARGLLESSVDVETRGGHLRVSWGGEGKSVTMSGPAVTVFEGEIPLT